MDPGATEFDTKQKPEQMPSTLLNTDQGKVANLWSGFSVQNESSC